jgi:hypothetical protein
VLSQQASVFSQAISVLSQQISALSQLHSALSAKIVTLSQTVSVISAGFGGMQMKVVQSDQAALSATALTKISGLSVSAAAAGIYQIEAILLQQMSAASVIGYGMSLATGTVKHAAFTWLGVLSQSVSTISVGNVQYGSFNEAGFGSITYSAIHTTNTTRLTKLEGVVAMSTTGGTLQLKTRVGTTGVIILKQGSFVRAFKIG